MEDGVCEGDFPSIGCPAGRGESVGTSSNLMKLSVKVTNIMGLLGLNERMVNKMRYFTRTYTNIMNCQDTLQVLLTTVVA